MRILTFKKELTVTGSQRTVKGEIVVTMNYATYKIAGTNGDFTTIAPKHKEEGFIDRKISFTSNECLSENAVISQIENFEKQVLEKLQHLANKKPAPKFLEKMKELGFLKT